MASKRRDYLKDVAIARALSPTQLKRLLRELVREAVNNAWATIDFTCEEAADRIAKELVP